MMHKVQLDSPLSWDFYNNLKHSNLEENNGIYHKYKYELAAVIVHLGEVLIGHYITFVRGRQEDGDHWLLYDGDQQSQVHEDFVFEQ